MWDAGIEKTIAQLSPVVSDLRAAYLHEQRSAACFAAAVLVSGFIHAPLSVSAAMCFPAAIVPERAACLSWGRGGVQDQKRETARDTLNKFIRQRERIQQLPKSVRLPRVRSARKGGACLRHGQRAAHWSAVWWCAEDAH
eukprot:1492041-Rhodomonas_salina.1